jgi:NDP-sugar pyrophosphorylase family protein
MKYTTPQELFDLTATIAAPLLAEASHNWAVLPRLRAFILALGPTLDPAAYVRTGDDIWIAKTAVVAPTAQIHGPCIIDEGAELRHCCFIRGSVIVGKNAVVGNSTELKNALLCDEVQVPHFNYVGDSILGRGAHMGAGAVTSNVKGDKSPVVIGELATGLWKVGAMLGLGGTLDVLANTVKRAPRWMINLRLEWLYRVAKEPWRIGRVASLPKFLLRIKK